MKKKLSFLILLTLCFSATKLLAQMPEDYVSIYELKGEAEKTPLVVDAVASYQLAGPAAGWGDLADWDFSDYRKLVINLTFDPADAGNMFAVRFNVNSSPGDVKVKLEKFTLPESGTDFSAEIDLQKYAEDGKVGVGGIVFYNGATHWSFNYDEGTATAQSVTINYVAVGDEIDYTIIPEDYVSIYDLKGEEEKTPLVIDAQASYQLAGPANGWGDLADWDFSDYRKLVINLTFDPADAGNMFAVRFNVNSSPGDVKVKLEKFTLPETKTNFSAVIDLEKYAEDGLVGVGGIVFYNGASHWSFNYDEGTPTAHPVTINYVAVGDEIDYTIMPEDYVSIYELKGEEEKTPLVVDAIASYQLAGPADGWGDLADWDFSDYGKLAINLTFDPADRGNMFAVRFNVNSSPGDVKVKLEKFTLPERGTNFSAVIDLAKYAEDGNVGVGGIVFYNGATHWSFNYDEGTATAYPVTINYVAVGNEPISITELVIENIIVGTVDSPEDFTGKLNISWDYEKIFMIFDITDDSIVSVGTSYQVDNIEVYFDMDNSKNIKWPRNAGWMSNDPTYDDNDYQFRLVPGVDFSVNNSFTGAVQEYEVTENGYLFKLTIPWDSLMVGFVPAIGTQIGFDVLVSDNDAVASDANRNQITLVSKTDKPYNDPSLFGTLQFEANGTFSLIPDLEPPGVATNFVATADQSDVTLTWDNATDNIAVLYYNVYQDSELLPNRVYPKETDNSLRISGLADGTYTFELEAVDNSFNVATSKASVSVTVTTVSVNDLQASKLSVYPNPVRNELNISGIDNISRIEVISITGNIVKTLLPTSSINVSELSEGLYFLKVYSNQDVFSTRFIKK